LKVVEFAETFKSLKAFSRKETGVKIDQRSSTAESLYPDEMVPFLREFHRAGGAGRVTENPKTYSDRIYPS
jgi:hypothetical protein